MTASGLLCLFALFCFGACVAQNGTLKSSGAYAKPATYGRELKGFDGQPVKRPDSIYFLYVQVKGTEKPEFSTIAYNGQRFTASVVPVEEKKVAVGVQKSNGKTVSLQRSTGYSLWRIELEPAEGLEAAAAKGLVVRGKAGSRSFVFTQPQWTFLKADLMP